MGLYLIKCDLNNCKYKAESLVKYLIKYNSEKNPIIGGIVTFTDYGWKYNDNEEYNYNQNDLSKWKTLEL